MASGYYEGEKGTYKLLEKKNLEGLSETIGVNLFAYADVWNGDKSGNTYVIRLSDIERNCKFACRCK